MKISCCSDPSILYDDREGEEVCVNCGVVGNCRIADESGGRVELADPKNNHNAWRGVPDSKGYERKVYLGELFSQWMLEGPKLRIRHQYRIVQDYRVWLKKGNQRLACKEDVRLFLTWMNSYMPIDMDETIYYRVKHNHKADYDYESKWPMFCEQVRHRKQKAVDREWMLWKVRKFWKKKYYEKWRWILFKLEGILPNILKYHPKSIGVMERLKGLFRDTAGAFERFTKIAGVIDRRNLPYTPVIRHLFDVVATNYVGPDPTEQRKWRVLYKEDWPINISKEKMLEYEEYWKELAGYMDIDPLTHIKKKFRTPLTRF